MWGGAGRQPDDSLDYDALAREITWRTGGVNGIIRTQRDRVSKHVDEALEKGAGERESEDAVREAMTVWRDSQTETIALTEAVHAFNEGTLTVAEMTGASHVYVQDGDEDDQPCIDANGSVWTIEKARENRLEHPRCRRSFLPINEVPSTT
jgi:hypothetical protein